MEVERINQKRYNGNGMGSSVSQENKENGFRGASYHLMERSARRQEIYQDDFDRQIFIELVRQEVRSCNCILHTIAILGNGLDKKY